MTKLEATQLLDSAVTDDLPCSINRSLTQVQAIGILRAAVNALPSDDSEVRDGIAKNIRRISRPVFRT